MKNSKLLNSGLIVFSIFSVSFLFSKIAHGAVTFPDFNKVQNIPQLIGTIYEYSLSIVGLCVFARFLYGGWLYFMSAGSSDKTGKAKEIMTNAVIGAIILFSAWLILNVINPDLVESTFNFGVPGGGAGTENINSNGGGSSSGTSAGQPQTSTPVKLNNDSACNEDSECVSGYCDPDNGCSDNPNSTDQIWQGETGVDGKPINTPEPGTEN